MFSEVLLLSLGLFFFLKKLYISFDSMPRDRRRKIEVPIDSHPQFELGDTAEDLQRRRREREERE